MTCLRLGLCVFLGSQASVQMHGYELGGGILLRTVTHRFRERFDRFLQPYAWRRHSHHVASHPSPTTFPSSSVPRGSNMGGIHHREFEFTTSYAPLFFLRPLAVAVARTVAGAGGVVLCARGCAAPSSYVLERREVVWRCDATACITPRVVHPSLPFRKLRKKKKRHRKHLRKLPGPIFERTFRKLSLFLCSSLDFRG